MTEIKNRKTVSWNWNANCLIDSTVSLITSATTASEAWNRLEKTYANKSHTHSTRLQVILANTTTYNKSIAKYTNTIKGISETFSLACSPMTKAKIIHTTLKGLGSKYKHLTATICARDTLISFEELHDKLVDYEVVLKRSTSKDESQSITAHFHQCQQNQYTKNRLSHSNNNARYSKNNNPRHYNNFGSSHGAATQ